MHYKNIPNILTIFRIVLTPIIIFFIFFKIDPVLYSWKMLNIDLSFQLNFIIAGILFCVASITDFLDGYLSKKNNWISEFGKIWDPIADKILINSILISFSIIGYIPYFSPILFIFRDTIVDAFRMRAIKNNIDVSANLLGKLKTIFQIIAILLIFFVWNNKSINLNYYLSNNVEYYLVQNFFIFASLIFSYLSGYFYIQKKFNKSI